MFFFSKNGTTKAAYTTLHICAFVNTFQKEMDTE